MATRMLIDGRHPEETRVAVVKGNRIEEFDFEAAARQQIKGNIYLAKITRVEPSLQAAFVDYGGNRHGFLAFSEIHPDYYQIPKEDRDALLREEQLLAEESARQDRDQDDDGQDDSDDSDGPDDGIVEIDAGVTVDGGDEQSANGDGKDGNGVASPEEHGNSEEDSTEALRRRRMALRRRYKIQEVIRRRQVMLVQVVKEERGNKGAALTTYISLAGRYSVLMPNTAHGGGISRKIANVADRKRLKAIMADINLPRSMGAIVRTAGLERTRAEIRRDFDYLTRLWDEIREKTLTSSAPALIYEDSDLIKRAIRDIYTRDVEEVLIDGEESYRQARSFMKLLMPSHVRKVQPYADAVPLFHRAGVEAQLAALMNPVVTLKSGGYIVISPTEALVSIDVNSGRSTREYNIEETALKTNIEAAEEVARQLRLRDLAGLVVVDFIDMEVHANNRKVERALKEALKSDRARIQVGRISAFGLLEMSRQRLRTGVLEASTEICPMCEGLGLVRTPGSAALAALRLLEEEAVKGRASHFRLRADKIVAIYMLNRKRAQLAELEERYGIVIEIALDDALTGGRVEIDASGPPPAEAPKRVGLAATVQVSEPDEDDIVEEEEDEEEVADNGGDQSQSHDGEEGETRRRRRRPRRRRPRRRENGDGEQTLADSDRTDAADDEGGDEDGAPDAVRGDVAVEDAEPAVAEESPAAPVAAKAVEAEPVAPVATAEVLPEAGPDEAEAEAAAKPAPRPRGRPRRKAEPAAEATEASAAVPADATVTETAEEKPAPRPRGRPRKKVEPAAEATEASADAPADTAATDAAEEKPAPRPRGRPRKKVEPAADVTEAPAAPAEAPAAPTEAPEAPVVEKPAATEPAAAPAATPEVAEPKPAAETSPETPDAPRRGWWQRTFGE